LSIYEESAAGVNFYWTVEDTPLAAAMHHHSTLFTGWNLVRVGSLLALAAVAMVAVSWQRES
jgi:hypothetical protein